MLAAMLLKYAPPLIAPERLVLAKEGMLLEMIPAMVEAVESGFAELETMVLRLLLL
jgi:hypothetical protein